MTERMTRAAYAKKCRARRPASLPARWKRRNSRAAARWCSTQRVAPAVAQLRARRGRAGLRRPPRTGARARPRRRACARWISCDSSSIQWGSNQFSRRRFGGDFLRGRQPLRSVLRKVERDQEVLEQVLEEPHFVLQPVIAVEDVQRAAVAAREFDALLHRHHVVFPAVHDGRSGNRAAFRAAAAGRASSAPAPSGTRRARAAARPPPPTRSRRDSSRRARRSPLSSLQNSTSLLTRSRGSSMPR